MRKLIYLIAICFFTTINAQLLKANNITKQVGKNIIIEWDLNNTKCIELWDRKKVKEKGDSIDTKKPLKTTVYTMEACSKKAKNKKNSSKEFTHIIDTMEQVLVGGIPLSVKTDSIPRLLDWNNDSLLDLMIGNDEEINIYINNGTKEEFSFTSPFILTLGNGNNTKTKIGDSKYILNTAFEDVNNDNKLDLFVGVGDKIDLYINIGSKTEPQFAIEPTLIVEQPLAHLFDVGDYNGDGVVDIVTGTHDSFIQVRNGIISNGTIGFSKPEKILTNPTAYNAHTRLVDIEGDGIKDDLLYSINWGSIEFFVKRKDKYAPKVIEQKIYFRNKNFEEFVMQNEVAGKIFPTFDFGDLNGDGIVDIVSGSNTGEVFFAKGISLKKLALEIESEFKSNKATMQKELEKNNKARKLLHQKLIAIHTAAYANFGGDREFYFDIYKNLILNNPEYLTYKHTNPDKYQHVALLAWKFWYMVSQVYGHNPSLKQRVKIADLLVMKGVRRKIFIDHGVFVMDNLSSNGISIVQSYLDAMEDDKNKYKVSLLKMNEFYGKWNDSNSPQVCYNGCINTFGTVKHLENVFLQNDYKVYSYISALVHEVNHNAVDSKFTHIFQEDGLKWYKRKYQVIKNASPDVIIWKVLNNGIPVVNWESTKNNFKTLGFWDGNDNNFNNAWNVYWNNAEGLNYSQTRWLRGGLGYIISAPQEAFATLSNQFFTNSQLMLEVALSRWDSGYETNINQFMLFAEYYSRGKDNVKFYQFDVSGDLTTNIIKLNKDSNGKIRSFTDLRGTKLSFTYDNEGMVKNIIKN